jgi:hypothetical protein
MTPAPEPAPLTDAEMADALDDARHLLLYKLRIQRVLPSGGIELLLDGASEIERIMRLALSQAAELESRDRAYIYARDKALHYEAELTRLRATAEADKARIAELVASVERWEETACDFAVESERNGRRATAAEARIAELEGALRESVHLQSHYAGLLNAWDGGQRRTFTLETWIVRLDEIGKKGQIND